MRQSKIGPVALAVAVAAALPAGAQGASNFYSGKSLTIYIAASPGGGYDSYGRLLGRHFSRHIPENPTVVVSNMPGAGGRKLANYLYNAAPKDGSAIGIMHHTTVYDAIFGEKGVKYEANKYNWIGSLDSFTAIGFAWHTSGVKTIDDARKKQIALGATGVGSATYQYPTLVNAMLGTRFKVVTGYKGSTEIYHAIEQGELNGMMGTAWSQMKYQHTPWVKENKVNVFLQLALEKHPDLANVPLAIDLARNAEDKRVMRFVFTGLKFSRPFMAPPGTPEAQVLTLRTAFAATAGDPKLRADAERAKLNVKVLGGSELQKLVEELYAAPKETVQRARAALGGK